MSAKGKAVHKTGLSRPPRKGTKSRIVVNALLRGTTASEVEELVGWGKGSFNAFLDKLTDQCGYDVRKTSIRPRSTYLIVGKMKWDGSYRSFRDPSETVRDPQPCARLPWE